MIKYPVPKGLRLVDRDGYIVELCKNKCVLHLGCTDSPVHESQLQADRLLHKKLQAVSSYLCGVDIDAKAIEWLRDNRMGSDLLIGNIEDKSFMSSLQHRKFDIIILSDVLEHLNNPFWALKNIYDISRHDTKFVVSVPNAFTIKSFFRVLMGHEFIHPDHLAFHSFYTLVNLLKRAHWEPLQYFSYTGGGVGMTAKITNYLLMIRPALAEGIGIVAVQRGQNDV